MRKLVEKIKPGEIYSLYFLDNNISHLQGGVFEIIEVGEDFVHGITYVQVLESEVPQEVLEDEALMEEFLENIPEDAYDSAIVVKSEDIFPSHLISCYSVPKKDDLEFFEKSRYTYLSSLYLKSALKLDTESKNDE